MNEREYAKEAFGAMKDDDEKGFVESFVAAIKACLKDYGKDEEEPDGDEE